MKPTSMLLLAALLCVAYVPVSQSRELLAAASSPSCGKPFKAALTSIAHNVSMSGENITISAKYKAVQCIKKGQQQLYEISSITIKSCTSKNSSVKACSSCPYQMLPGFTSAFTLTVQGNISDISMIPSHKFKLAKGCNDTFAFLGASTIAQASLRNTVYDLLSGTVKLPHNGGVWNLGSEEGVFRNEGAGCWWFCWGFRVISWSRYIYNWYSGDY